MGGHTGGEGKLAKGTMYGAGCGAAELDPLGAGLGGGGRRDLEKELDRPAELPWQASVFVARRRDQGPLG